MHHSNMSPLMTLVSAILLTYVGGIAALTKADPASSAAPHGDSAAIVLTRPGTSTVRGQLNSDTGIAASTKATSKKVSLSVSGRFRYRMLQFMDVSNKQKSEIIWGNERQMQRTWRHEVAGDALVKISTPSDFSFNAGYRSSVSLMNMRRVGNNIRDVGSGFYLCAVKYARPHIETETGIFQLKYNPDSKNLGEYLIKSGVYPGYVFSGREWAVNIGIHLRTNIVPHLTQDVLFVSECDHKPYTDFSPGYLLSYTMADAFTLGGGIMLHRFVSTQKELTTPPDENGVSYTHRGIKLMGRFSLDIKKLFGGPKIFTANDLRIYSEAAILGVKSYPVYYTNLIKRIPVMFGINVPTFGLLDYCSVECEWYGSEYINLPPALHYRAIPLEKQRSSEDNYKWSVSMRRTIRPGMAIDTRIASDYLRFEDASGAVEEFDRFDSWRQWYWSGSLSVIF